MPNSEYVIDTYDNLEPFVKYVTSVHDGAITLDIIRTYALKFTHPELTFEGANFC